MEYAEAEKTLATELARLQRRQLARRYVLDADVIGAEALNTWVDHIQSDLSTPVSVVQLLIEIHCTWVHIALRSDGISDTITPRDMLHSMVPLAERCGPDIQALVAANLADAFRFVSPAHEPTILLFLDAALSRAELAARSNPHYRLAACVVMLVDAQYCLQTAEWQRAIDALKPCLDVFTADSETGALRLAAVHLWLSYAYAQLDSRHNWHKARGHARDARNSYAHLYGQAPTRRSDQVAIMEALVGWADSTHDEHRRTPPDSVMGLLPALTTTVS